MQTFAIVSIVIILYVLIELLVNMLKKRRAKNTSSHDYIDELHPSKCSKKESCLNCLHTKGCPHFASLEYDAGYSCMPIKEYIEKYGDE